MRMFKRLLLYAVTLASTCFQMCIATEAFENDPIKRIENLRRLIE
jgi:hypothetical protein